MTLWKRLQALAVLGSWRARMVGLFKISMAVWDPLSRVRIKASVKLPIRPKSLNCEVIDVRSIPAHGKAN